MLFCEIVFVVLLWSVSAQKNNVCKRFEDYANKDNSTNCWYNPDVGSTPENVARNHGFEFQTHSVVTKDGYRLTLFRVQDKFSSVKKQPVLLHHGLMSSAMSYMSTGNRSLAFFLAERGFDVWLANHRGNPYSTGHDSMNMTNPKFWDFSFHEIALYDIPAVVEYISKKTSTTKKIIYIGHSMGTTISFIYTSTKPKHAETYLAGVVSLSPVASMKDVKVKVPTHLQSWFKTLLPSVNEFVQSLYLNKIVVLFPYPKRLSKLLIKTCGEYPTILTCKNILTFANEPQEGQDLAELMPVMLSYHPGRASVKSLAHYIQILTSGRFQGYDYGVWGNMKKYSSMVPPVYNISKIRVPVHLFYGSNDVFTAESDVSWLFNKLQVKEKSMRLVPKDPNYKYNHIDYLFANNIESEVYKPLLKIMTNM